MFLEFIRHTNPFYVLKEKLTPTRWCQSKPTNTYAKCNLPFSEGRSFPSSIHLFNLEKAAAHFLSSAKNCETGEHKEKLAQF